MVLCDSFDGFHCLVICLVVLCCYSVPWDVDDYDDDNCDDDEKETLGQGGNRGTHAQACKRHNCLVTSPFAPQPLPLLVGNIGGRGGWKLLPTRNLICTQGGTGS